MYHNKNAENELFKKLKNKDWVGAAVNMFVLPKITERIQKLFSISPGLNSTNSSLYSAAYKKNKNLYFPVKDTTENIFHFVSNNDHVDLNLKELFRNQLIEFKNCALSTVCESQVQTLTTAIDIIRQNSTETFMELANLIDTFVLLESEHFRSASHPHFIGALFIKVQSCPSKLAISIVHELAHQELFLLNFTDRLINEQFDYNEIHAPFQNRSRPPIGRLHSAHALFRMIQFENKIEPELAIKHQKLLEETKLTFNQSELTQFCQGIIHDVY